MGRTLLILLSGFAMSFGVLSLSKNQRLVDSTSRVVDSYTGYSSKNAATSGAYMALNRLYLDSGWRAGYSNLMLAGNAVNVLVEDASDDASIGSYRVRIRATGANNDTASSTEVVAFDRSFDTFAVWDKDTVISISARDSVGNSNSSLIVMDAPFMPRIDNQEISTRASIQNSAPPHVYGGDFTPSDGYPNGSYYYAGTRPNVTTVGGDLLVQSGRTVYGVFSVQGDVILEGNAKIYGIVYLPNSASEVRYTGSDATESLVRGGILSWGTIDGTGGNIAVQHYPSYLREFVSRFVPNNPPMRVISWK